MKLGDFNLWSWLQQQYRLSTQKWKELEHRKVLMVVTSSFIGIVASVIVCYLIIPAITDIVIYRLRVLHNGTDALSRWERQQIPLISNLYLWNLTNPEEVTKGLSNPRFREAGPYAFERITVKTPIEFNEDSIVYMKTTTYHYRADLTAPRSLDDTFVTLQAALYGAAVSINSMAPSMLYILEKAVPSLFPGTESIFVEVRVGDYLFDGLVLNCSGSGFSAAQMVCGMLPNTVPATIRKLPNSRDYAYSFLHHKNGTEQGPYEENRGINDIRQVAQIIKYKDQSVLDVWQPDSKCDRLRGTDSLTFGPFVSKDDKIEIFIDDICQVLPLFYQNEDRLHGLTVYKFILKDWLESKDTNPDNKCYCMEGRERYCSKNGVRDISDCTKAPVILSQPHFLEADAEFREYAQGSSPDPEKHLSMLYIEPQTGTPVKGGRRVQFNMPLMRIKGFSFVENVTEGLFPLLWIDECVNVDSASLWPVRLPLMAQWVANFISVCVGSLLGKIFVCSLLSYLYLTRSCCFHNVTSNRVTALFNGPRSSSTDVAQTST